MGPQDPYSGFLLGWETWERATGREISGRRRGNQAKGKGESLPAEDTPAAKVGDTEPHGLGRTRSCVPAEVGRPLKRAPRAEKGMGLFPVA